MKTKTLSFALILLVGCFGESLGQEAGVILGLRYETPIPKPLPYYAGSADSLSRAAYRTLLIARDDDTFVVRTDEDDLLVPRAAGFWRVGTKRSIYNNWVEDFVWAGAEGIPRTLAGIQPYNGEYCKGHRKQIVLYAGPRYVSLEQRSAGYCEGAAHPWFFNTLATVPIDSTVHSGLPIDAVLGEAAYQALQASVRSFLDSLEDGEYRAAFIEEPDAANWGLRRQAGRWTVGGRLEAAEEIYRDIYVDLPLSLAVPTALTGGEAPLTNWARIQSFATDAVDAFIAPDRDWMIILHPDRLTVHAIQGDAVSATVLTLPSAPGTRAVLVQWARSTRLQRWIRYFEQPTSSSE